MAIDLKSLSTQQLAHLIEQAKREKSRKQKRAPIAAVRKKLAKLAVAEGYSIEELFGDKSAARAKPASGATPRKSTKGSTVAPKYRNPANPAETWSGRGKHPRWLAGLIGSGRNIDDFRI